MQPRPFLPVDHRVTVLAEEEASLDQGEVVRVLLAQVVDRLSLPAHGATEEEAAEKYFRILHLSCLFHPVFAFSPQLNVFLKTRRKGERYKTFWKITY